jgi:NADH:ubiquinone oxidoreductase subunit E
LKGSRQIIESLQYLAEKNLIKDKIELSGTFCTGNCTEGVCVTLDEKPFSISPATVDAFFEREVLGAARG